MKKLSYTIVSLLLFFGMLFGCSNDENETRFITDVYQPETRETTTELPRYDLVCEGTLTVAITPTINPILYKENGEIQGFDAEIATKLAQELGYTIKFVEVAMEERLSAVISGQADIAIGAITNTESHTDVLFSDSYASVGVFTEDGVEKQNYVIAVGQKNKLLCEDIDSQIDHLTSDGIIEQLSEKYKTNEKVLNLYGFAPEHVDLAGQEIRFPAVGELSFTANETTQNVHMFATNITDNEGVLIKYQLFLDSNQNDQLDDADELILETGLIAPGYTVAKAELTRPLAAGTYSCYVLGLPYSYDEEQRPLNKAQFHTRIVVQ